MDLQLHGLGVRLEMGQTALTDYATQLLQPLSRREGSIAEASVLAATGIVRAFDFEEVARSISSQAVALSAVDDLIQIYQLAERFWIVDEAWGICELNLLKRMWRSWVLPDPALDAVPLLNATVLAPIAHLLRPRGLELIPAVSVENNGFGALILSPYGIGRELQSLVVSGYRIIGQSWTALRIIGHRVRMMAMPGAVLDMLPNSSVLGWHDLADEFPAHVSQHGWCEAVFTVAPGRRTITKGTKVPRQLAIRSMCQAWPICDLPPNRRRLTPVASQLAHHSPVYNIELSRRCDHFVRMIESVRLGRQRPMVRVMVPAEVRKYSQALSRKAFIAH